MWLPRSVCPRDGFAGFSALGSNAPERSTQRKPPSPPDDEAGLAADIIALATCYGRYGYRRVTALLRHAGWQVNRKRVGRIWRREGLKVPHKQPRKGRLWLNGGSCGRSTRTMSGPATSSRIALTMDGNIACSTSAPSSRENVWPSG